MRSISFVSAELGCARGWFALSSIAFTAWASAQYANPPFIDQFISTGDDHFVAAALPVSSQAEIQASFDLIQAIHPTRRIYWRGLQDSVLSDATIPIESPRITSYFNHAKNLVNNVGINQIAVQEAHARGMQIYGEASLYEWNVNPDGNSFFGWPGEYQNPLTLNNPGWKPVDKYGHRTQSGPIEFAHPSARQAVTNWYQQRVQQDGYDGVMFHTYVENVTTRFGDEFGFSQPIVDEFKNRYGVDIRHEAFNKQNWYKLRGEYTTAMLQQLRAAIPGKGVAMGISPVNPDLPQYWYTSEYPTATNIEMNWRKWADDHTVDNFVVWGGNSGAFAVRDTLYNYKQSTANAAMEVQFITSSPLSLGQQSEYNRGLVAVASLDVLGESYLLAQSKLGTQPVSALSDPNVYKRMKLLQQIIDGQTTGVTAAQVTPLLGNANLLERRMALFALAKIGNTASIPTLEEMLQDPQPAVRNAAMVALQTLNRSASVTAVFNAVAQNGTFPLMDAAYQVIANPLYVSQIATSASSSNTNVRSLAMRALAQFPRNQDVPLLQNSLNDAEPAVRYYAVQALGKLTNQLAVTALINRLAGTDTVTSAQSAKALSDMLSRNDAIAVSRRTEILDALNAAMKARGDASARGDTEWAYRLIAPGLIAAGADGQAMVRQNMNQRNDRRLSEQAWTALYLPEQSGSFTPATESQDAYAHFKHPRWDTQIAASDSLDTKPDGPIAGARAETGNRFFVDAGISADQIVQSAVNNGGKALSLTRSLSAFAQGHQVRLASYDLEGDAAEISTVRAKADWLRSGGSRDSDGATFSLTIPGYAGPAVSVDANSNYRVWKTDGTATGGQWILTPYQVGKAGWETIEIVQAWDEAGGASLSTLTGSYDVYLSRAAGNSLGSLKRTLIANDVPSVTIPERLLQSLQMSNVGDGAASVTTYWDNLSLTVGIGLLSSRWNVDSNGSWTTDANWKSIAPRGIDSNANFGAVITSARTVTVDAARTVGTINFNNSSAPYTIAGGGTLTLDVTSGEAGINVLSGSHTISAPIALNDDATITVTPSSSVLTLSGDVNAAGRVLTKAGAGTAQFQNVRASSLSVTGGAVKISAKGSPASASGTSVVSSLSLDPSARLDLTNNALVVDYGFISPVSTIRSSLLSGYANGSWTGNGIISSSAAANGITAVGYAEASDLFSSFPGSFAGQNVDSTSLLLRYTLGADANLDGVVNSQDFNLLIAHYGQSNARWSFGDFDYNGKVDTLDFNRLAGTFGATLPAGSASLGSIVPEPAGLTMLVAAAAMLVRRNRASRR